VEAQAVPSRIEQAQMMTSADDDITLRTIVDLPDPERAQLDALCKQRGLSRAEAMRQALQLLLAQQQPGHSAVFGLWRDRPEDSVALQQALRSEWNER
jgi:ligand-binding sensor domain-containing protein